MGFNINNFLSSIFGNKASRDMKLIKPFVNQVLEVYPEIQKLNNDELRAKTDEIKDYIQAQVAELKAQIDELTQKIEKTQD